MWLTVQTKARTEVTEFDVIWEIYHMRGGAGIAQWYSAGLWAG